MEESTLAALVQSGRQRLDRLEGNYPQTRLVAEGEHTRADGGTWTVRLPIWELTNHERPNVSEIERLMYIDIVEA